MVKKLRFRSITDLGDYHDNEVNTLPSCTDESQDEPIEKLVARMLRGDIGGSAAQVQYQFGPSDDVEDAFKALQPQEIDGFDISEVPSIIANAKASIKALERLKNDAKRKHDAKAEVVGSSEPTKDVEK